MKTLEAKVREIIHDGFQHCYHCECEGTQKEMDSLRDQATTSILALIEGEVAKRDEQIESLDDQLEASMVERYQILAVLDKYAWSK